ncbi:MAG: T9SS type A sorting domain-containing protein [Bacteroidetes bacterium]|nr:T9SS type A sorting domain-containing protein [Bacteroidota bacterium]
MKKCLNFLLFIYSFATFSQNYTSYFTGNSTDLVTNPQGGICLMGGASEDDNAMKWFLQRADGGDVLVLRATGSDGYNTYLYSGLGITVNSVETIVCNNTNASSDAYVINKINQAEAIWFAGGNQWTYISYWRNSPVNQAINQAIHERNVVIGGTSAGMAIQGKYYFSAQNGTVTSNTATSNPYANSVTVDSTTFIQNNILQKVITDTHFDSPDRKGRLVAFLSRIYTDYNISGYAIACDEYTAVCIEPTGQARVFGGYPSYDDNAYFVQVNCELPDQDPEVCSAGNALTWNHNGQAVKAFQIKGDATGSKLFDLNSWETTSSGSWYNWSVANGTFQETVGIAPSCSVGMSSNLNKDDVLIYPNPATHEFILTIPSELIGKTYNIIDQLGKIVKTVLIESEKQTISIEGIENGCYLIYMDRFPISKLFVQWD